MYTPADTDAMTNVDIAELLAREAEHARMPAQKALRRASRRAFFWPQEASLIVQQGRSLTELSGVGPYLQRLIAQWIADPPVVPQRPELRRNFLTLTAARAAMQPSWLRSIRGDLQMHTQWSDGEASIADMADIAISRGYQYIAITDHSKGLKIAGGINEEQLKQQGREIATLNHQLSGRFFVLRSIELNLNPQGEGDMDEKALADVDLVLGCFHSSLRTKDDQTERYLAALRNPKVQILGHPRGRIYNYRAGLTADWRKVFAVAADLDKAVEIDAYPDRQDLSVDLVRLANRAGCRISLGTDAHGPSQLFFMEYAAAAAMLAGVRRDRILNFLTRDELLSWAASVRYGGRNAA